MPDGAEFPIKITTTQSGQGMERARDEFGRFKKEVKETTTEVKETSKAHEEVADKAKDAGKKQAEAAETVKLGHREVRETVRGVGEAIGAQLPVMGLFMEQTTLGLGLVIAGLQGMRTAWEQMRAPIDAANEALAAIDSSRIKSAAESASELANSLGDIGRHESDLEASFKRGTTALEDQIKLFNEQRDAVIKVAEAEEKLYEARLEYQTSQANPNSGVKERNDALKAQAQLQLDILRGQNDVAKLQNEIDRRSEDYSNARTRTQPVAGGNKSQDQLAIEAAEAAAKGPHAAAGDADTALKELEKQGVPGAGRDNAGGPSALPFEDAKNRLKDLKEQLQSDIEGGNLLDADAMKREIERIDPIIDEYSKRHFLLQESVNRTAQAEKDAQQKVAEANAQSDEDQKRGGKQAEENLRRLQKELDLAQQTNEQVQAANAAAASAHISAELTTKQRELSEKVAEAEKSLKRAKTGPEQADAKAAYNKALGDYQEFEDINRPPAPPPVPVAPRPPAAITPDQEAWQREHHVGGRQSMEDWQREHHVGGHQSQEDWQREHHVGGHQSQEDWQREHHVGGHQSQQDWQQEHHVGKFAPASAAIQKAVQQNNAVLEQLTGIVEALSQGHQSIQRRLNDLDHRVTHSSNPS